MNVDTGVVLSMEEIESKKLLDHFTPIPGDVELTEVQKKRLEEKDQPVVKLKDTKSQAGKWRLEQKKRKKCEKHQRYLDRKKKQRDGNKKAEHRKNNFK